MYTVKVERLVTIQTGWVISGVNFSEDEFTQQFNTLFVFRNVGAKRLSVLKNKYSASWYRVTSWSK